jgi:signal peptidase II
MPFKLMNVKRNVLIFSVVLALDLITKVLAQRHFVEGEILEVFPGFFNLTLVYNPGAAFGLFAGLPDFWRRIVLILVSILALAVVFRFMLKEAQGDPWAQTALSGILGGAIGNIIDRIRLDSVVDFLDFYWGAYHWPAFNVADSAITLGVFVLVSRILFAAEPSKPVTS